MSYMTRQYFIKLHQKMMVTDLDYKKGYEYSKLYPWESFPTEELVDMVKAYLEVARRDKCQLAYGHAHAVREVLWARLGGGVAA